MSKKPIKLNRIEKLGLLMNEISEWCVNATSDTDLSLLFGDHYIGDIEKLNWIQPIKDDHIIQSHKKGCDGTPDGCNVCFWQDLMLKGSRMAKALDNKYNCLAAISDVFKEKYGENYIVYDLAEKFYRECAYRDWLGEYVKPVPSRQNITVEDFKASLEKAVKEQRKELGLSKAELIKLSSIGMNSLNRIESNSDDVSIGTTLKALLAMEGGLKKIAEIVA